MKIVIIGSGWLGASLAEQLYNNGHEVVCTYRSNRPELPENILTFPMDFSDAEFTDYLKAADTVIFAFPAPKSGKSHAEICSEASTFCQPECTFLFTSTTGVYPDKDMEFNEQSEVNLNSPHVITEQQLITHFQRRITIVRLAGLVGNGRFPVRMMSASGKTYNGNESCNLLHHTDAVGILTFLTENRVDTTILNACAPLHPLKGEYYTWMAEQLGIPAPLFEQGKQGKRISAELSQQLGYHYVFDDPYLFLGNDCN